MSNFPHLDPDVKNIWIKGLRSNKYKPAKFVMAREDFDGMHFDPFGVLCMEKELEIVEGDNKTFKFQFPDPSRDGEIEESSLKPSLFWFRGLFQEPVIARDLIVIVDRISTMNDFEPGTPTIRTFYKVANWIEENL